MNDEITQQFINAYRDMSGQRERGLLNLENTRRNQFQNIMSGANTLGMMYSNFPERAKIQYDANTYTPAKIKMFNTYQTGLDKLRSNMINYINQLASINEATADLNESNQVESPINAGGFTKYSAIKDDKDALASLGLGTLGFDEAGGTQYVDAEGNKIRMGTMAKRLGAATNEDILSVAEETLRPSEYIRLKNIFDLQKNTKHPNLVFNTGSNWISNPGRIDGQKYYLSPEDSEFLARLGLSFGS